MLYVLLQVLYTTIKNNLINIITAAAVAAAAAAAAVTRKYCMRTYIIQ